MVNYSTSESFPPAYPAKIISSFLYYGEEEDDWVDVGQMICKHPGWGEPTAVYEICRDGYPLPYRLQMTWLSVVEEKTYSLKEKLNKQELETLFNQKDDKGNQLFLYITVGMAPFGGVAVWTSGYKKSSLLAWMKCQEIVLDGEEVKSFFGKTSVNSFCRDAIIADALVSNNLSNHGLPDPHLFDRMMQQFTYRFQPILKKWDDDRKEWTDYAEDEKKPELDFVEVKCHDGTFDRLRDGSLLNYHEAGKPSRVCVGWHVGKREYSAYFFFSHDELVPLFRTCYGAHPETKVDFLLQIDPENNKYEPALFRYGMKEPLTIPENTCQVLVFRNKFECFRSPNYSQPKGAWR